MWYKHEGYTCTCILCHHLETDSNTAVAKENDVRRLFLSDIQFKNYNWLYYSNHSVAYSL